MTGGRGGGRRRVEVGSTSRLLPSCRTKGRGEGVVEGGGWRSGLRHGFCVGVCSLCRRDRFDWTASRLFLRRRCTRPPVVTSLVIASLPLTVMIASVSLLEPRFPMDPSVPRVGSVHSPLVPGSRSVVCTFPGLRPHRVLVLHSTVPPAHLGADSVVTSRSRQVPSRHRLYKIRLPRRQ